MESVDLRLVSLIVNGREVPVVAQEFADYCVRVGWPEPPIVPGRTQEFDIEPWLVERALDATHAPAALVQGEWLKVRTFAQLIGLKTDFIQAVRADA